MEIQIISGFLGAGKTTFLNKYLPTLSGRTAVIENEFGDIGLDGDLIQGDMPVKELYAGCICCSLAMDFRKGIKEIWEQFHPDRIVIEPSGVGKLSDIVKACARAKEKEGINLRITKLIAIVDLTSFEEYIDGFGVFYLDQIQHAGLLLLSNLDQMSREERDKQVIRLKEENPEALLYEDDWRQMDPDALRELVDMVSDYGDAPEEVHIETLPADRVFSSIAVRNPKEFTRNGLEKALEELKSGFCGQVLRAKGVVKMEQGEKMHVEFTPVLSKMEVLEETKESEKVNGENMDCKMIIIGCGLKKEVIEELFFEKGHMSEKCNKIRRKWHWQR